jgi:hypothetical protein
MSTITKEEGEYVEMQNNDMSMEGQTNEDEKA